MTGKIPKREDLLEGKEGVQTPDLRRTGIPVGGPGMRYSLQEGRNVDR